MTVQGEAVSDLATALASFAVIQCLCWEPVNASEWHYNEGVSEKQEVISLMCSNLGLVLGEPFWNRSIDEALKKMTWNISVTCHLERAGLSLEPPTSLESKITGKRKARDVLRGSCLCQSLKEGAERS